MDEKQFKTLIETIENSIDKKIEVKVNGRIDALHKKFDTHIEEMKPLLAVYSTTKNTGKFLKWFFGIVILVGGGMAILKGWAAHLVIGLIR